MGYIFRLLWKQSTGIGLNHLRSVVRIEADDRNRDAFVRVEGRHITVRKDPGERRDRASLRPLLLMRYRTYEINIKETFIDH